MARIRLLLSTGFSALITATLLSVPVSVQATETICLPANAALGSCPRIDAGVTRDGVQLDGQAIVPGSGGNAGAGSGSGAGSGAGAGGSGGGSGVVVPPRVVRDEYTVTGPVTLSDLVNFRPARGTNHMQPNGWMIVGLDTNFYAQAGVQVQNGTLLGEPARVRFTPVRYRWSYGDGTGTSSTTAGDTWQALRVAEFDPTPNSHVYQQRGTYFIDLSIDFAAEYTWAGGHWTPIAGSIAVPANRLVATAGSAKTVLVEHDCITNPTGPGC